MSSTRRGWEREELQRLQAAADRTAGFSADFLFDRELKLLKAAALVSIAESLDKLANPLITVTSESSNQEAV